MDGLQKYATIVNIFMNIILGIAISVAVLLYMGTMLPVPFTLEGVIASSVSSFCIGFVVGTLLPIMDWSFAIGHALKVKNGVIQYLITSCMFGIIMAFFITCGNAIINQLTMGGWAAVGGFIATYLGFIFLVAIVLVIIALKPVQMLATSISGFDPTMAPDAEEA